MIVALLDLAKALWPFLKESFLKNKTLRETIRQNKTAVILLTMMALMMFFNLVMYETTLASRQERDVAVRVLNDINLRLVTAEKRNQLLEAERISDQAQLGQALARIEELDKELLAVGDRHDRFERWLQHCGIDTDYVGPNLPQCRAAARPKPRSRRPAPVRPPPRPDPPDEQPVAPERKPFFDRLKGIFRRSDPDDSQGAIP